jgi:hypothetical protein
MPETLTTELKIHTLKGKYVLVYVPHWLAQLYGVKRTTTAKAILMDKQIVLRFEDTSSRGEGK